MHDDGRARPAGWSPAVSEEAASVAPGWFGGSGLGSGAEFGVRRVGVVTGWRLAQSARFGACVRAEPAGEQAWLARWAEATARDVVDDDRGRRAFRLGAST